jgi:hypothetical protein
VIGRAGHDHAGEITTTAPTPEADAITIHIGK